MRAAVESLCFTAYWGLSKRGDNKNGPAISQGTLLNFYWLNKDSTKLLHKKMK